MRFKDMNTPNKLTTIRMFCVVIVFILFAMYFINKQGFLPLDLTLFDNDGGRLTLLQIVIAVLFAFASITDFIDGNMARARNIVSDYGKLMDPLADKLLVNTTLICLIMINAFNYSNVLGVIAALAAIATIARDIFVDALRMQALKKGVVSPASIIGKMKTATLMPGIVIMIVASSNIVLYYIGVVLVTLGGIFAVIGGVKYFNSLKKYISE